MSFGNKDILEYTNAYIAIHSNLFSLNSNKHSIIEYLAWLINSKNTKRVSAAIAVINDRFPQYNDLLIKLMNDNIQVLF